MSQQPLTSRQAAPAGLPPDAVVPREGGQTQWTSAVVFAGAMMVLLGGFNVLDGIVALVNSEWFADDVLAFNFTAWGWFWIVFGTVTLVAGFGVLAGQTWARVVGVIVAALNAVAQLAFAGAYPVWSMLIIMLDVIVIYALTVHGRELGQTRT